ncbi:MAG: glycine cleavage system protein H, partial [Gammaproteobacteria bacterium]|nr:glycine cleavage system protein H [Gammaproteobacteria bacterium]
SGEIIETNGLLEDAPETVNSVPYDDGWFYKIQISDELELDELMDADAYSDHCEDD